MVIADKDENSERESAITFLGTFYKASTLIDGGWRISLDLDESQAQNVTKIANFKNCLLQFAIVPIKTESTNRGPWK